MEFRRALKTLSALPMDESIKYQSTFATASTIGVTLEMLLSSIEFYKKVLINEEANFTKAIKDQTSVNISDKITEKENVLKSIVAKSEQIKKLTNEIGALQTEIEQLTLSIETAESKIKETALNFESSINVIKNQLDQDAIKLKQYIK
jgi:predicted  nucleic acid-binding Zn-ribbon protein